MSHFTTSNTNNSNNSNNSNTNTATNSTKTLDTVVSPRVAGLAAIGAAVAVVLSACGVGSQAEQRSAPVEVPAVDIAEVVAEPVADVAGAVTPDVDTHQTATEQTGTVEIAPVEIAPVDFVPIVQLPVEDPQLDDFVPTAVQSGQQLIPASGASFPCAGYHHVDEVPAHPCSKGYVVEYVQSALRYADDTFVIDGHFGPATYDGVIGLQSMFAMEQTGVIDQALIDMIDTAIYHPDPLESWLETPEEIAAHCDAFFAEPWDEPTMEDINFCSDNGIELVSGH